MSQLLLAAETLSGTAPVGGTEYNGTIFTNTPMTGQRGVIPSEQFFRLNAGVAGANATGAQSFFGVGVTLSASTVYEFEMTIVMSKAAGATSHSFSIGFGGTATVNNISYQSVGGFISNATPSGQLTIGALNNGPGFVANSVSATVIVTGLASVGLSLAYVIKGTVSVNAGGTFIPQYSLSVAPGGAYTTQAGSYMKIKPIGVSGANVSVGTWA